MNTLYGPMGCRYSWQRPAPYRRKWGFEFNPKSTVVYLGWLVVEYEWYDCSMTEIGIIDRKDAHREV